VSAEESEVILGQAPEVVASFFTGEGALSDNETKFIITESGGDSGERERFIAVIGRGLYQSIFEDGGFAQYPLRGGAEIHLTDKADGQELVVCKGSLDFGGVKETIARQIAERVREILEQGTAKKIAISVRDLIEPKHPCFFRGKLNGGR